ncbi:MAG: hypothetical protein ABSE87_13540 [Terracidiphilus sp.]|jgi:hypothetical protein
MPETKPEMERARKLATLNDAQQRHLSITCKYIDGLLCDIEHALHARESQSPFPHYLADVSPAQARLIEDYIRSLRVQLLKTLEWQQMKPDPPEIPVSRLVITDLGFVEIAVDELRPRDMRGYGAVPDGAIGGLNQVVDELRALVHSMTHILREELGMNRNSRVGAREQTVEEE